MQFKVSKEQVQAARAPHELMLLNLIGNHILWFVGSLGIAGSYWQPVAMVPVVSLSILGYLIWRGKVSRQKDNWFVMCHWQIAARRGQIFLMIILSMILVILLVGGLGYFYFHWMKEVVIAIIGGVGVLPVMVTVLILIIMESDAMDQASHGKVPENILKKFPAPEAEVEHSISV